MAVLSFGIKVSYISGSGSSTTVNVSEFIKDYENGKIATNRNIELNYLGVNVTNVKKGQTVTGAISVFGKSFPISFTAKYEDTYDRHLSIEQTFTLTALEFYNYIRSNNGMFEMKLTSGSPYFYGPLDIVLGAYANLNDGNMSTDFSLSSKDITNPIRLQLDSGKNGCRFKVTDVDTNVVLFDRFSSGNYIDMPSGTINNPSTKVRIRYYPAVLLESASSGGVYYDTYPYPIYKDFTSWTIEYPTMINLNYVGEHWERSITFNWIATNQDGYEYELYSNNVIVKSGTGGKETNFTIPANTFTSKLNPIIRIRNYREYAGVKYYSSWVDKSLTLKDIEATISSMLVEGDHWEKDIKVSWQSNNQQKFKIEVFKSNAIVKTYTGTTATSYTINPEQLGEGAYVIRVSVAYADRWVNSIEKSVNLKNITATLSNIALSGSNIDLSLTLSWDSTDQQNYEVEIYNGDSKVTTFTGTTNKSVTIPNNTLTTGLHSFRVRVAFKDRWTEWKEITSTLIETLPSIGVLEPDGVITERDESTRIWWTSQNQSKWKLVIDGNTTFTGTTETEKVLTPGTLQTGPHSMVLTVWYVTLLEVEKPQVTRKSEWIVQGKPPTPTITSADIFNTNRPTIVWDTQDQQGYILEILKSNEVIYSTDWENGLIVEHKINTYLENGTYTVRVKVMNQYSLESNWGTKQITINTEENTNIKLSSIEIGNDVQLSWDNTSDKFVKFYIIRNGIVIAKTTATSYTDHTAHLDNIYTVRGITSNGVFKDSNNAYECVEINRSILATVDKPHDQLKAAFFTSTDRFNANLGLECTLLQVTGREYPIAVFGEHSSKSINLKLIQCDSLDKLIEMFNRRQVFCYRDASEKAYFVINQLPYTRNSNLTDYDGTITATLVDYKEGVEYD